MEFKTPGVLIQEINAFPNSVVEVATAIPAFIGYTQKAAHQDNSLLNKPWRITSMGEFVECFGVTPKFEFAIKNTAGTLSVEQTGGLFLLHQSMRLFFQNGGGACYVVSIGTFAEAQINGISATKMQAGIDTLKREQEPTLLVVPDAMHLDFASCIVVQQHMLAHCGYEMKNRFAILDIHNGYRSRAETAGDCVTAFRNALGINFLNFGAAYYPWVNTSVVQDDELDYTVFTDAISQSLLKALVTEDACADKNVAEVEKIVNAIGQSFDDFAAQYRATPGHATADANSVDHAFRHRIHEVQQSLMLLSPRYATLFKLVKQQLNLLPPSAAMAGVYTAVDQSRGVWKAPANVSLNAVVSPAVNLTQEEQEDLNVATTGKSVNAIRSFIGEGTLVWGARTLDGNSLDWRYINVRRTIIMIEESLRLACKAYIFEPNAANTWVSMKSMVHNFLLGIWRRGGLAGSRPDDAFAVQIGLHETMTAEDLQEGLLRITVLVALTRPAEFIEITFQQQQQKS